MPQPNLVGQVPKILNMLVQVPAPYTTRRKIVLS